MRAAAVTATGAHGTDDLDSAGSIVARIPEPVSQVASGVQVSSMPAPFGSIISVTRPNGSSVYRVGPHTAAAISGGETPALIQAGRPPSGTSGRAPGGRPGRPRQPQAAPACSRGQSRPAVLRPVPASSSDPSPSAYRAVSPAALAHTGDTDRARPGFKPKSLITPDGPVPITLS